MFVYNVLASAMFLVICELKRINLIRYLVASWNSYVCEKKVNRSESCNI